MTARRLAGTRAAALAAAVLGWALMLAALPTPNGAFLVGAALAIAGSVRLTQLARN